MAATSSQSYTAIAIAIVIAGILISASIYIAVQSPTKTTTTTRTVTTTGTSSQTACSQIIINGTGYCSLDVTDDMTFEQSGYSTLNAPVTFMGVTFESTCQSDAAICATESESTVSSGFIPFELIFPNGEIQYLSALYPPGIPGQDEYYLTTTQASPAAGFLLEGANTAPYLRLILLVEPEQQPTPTAFTNAADNLQLQLYLNSSSATGFAVSISVDEYNTLAVMNNVTVANEWVAALNGGDGAPCGDDGPPIGFAIADGDYTSSNVTSASFLDLVNPGATYSCPLYLGYGSPAGFVFFPMTDVATSYGCDREVCMSGSMSTASWGAVTGYWNEGGVFTSFPRGTYTVLAEDEWGNSVLAYFTVA